MPKNAQTTAQLHSSHKLERNAQNSPRQASTVHESCTSRCSSWIQKRQRNQRSNVSIHWITEKATEFQKNIYFCFIDYAKAFDCVDHNKLWKILKEMGIPDHPTCLLRKLYAGQEATIKAGHGTTAWFQIRKGVHQGCMLLPCLFNLYTEYIKLESRFQGEISITSDMQMIPPYGRKQRRTKEPLDYK